MKYFVLPVFLLLNIASFAKETDALPNFPVTVSYIQKNGNPAPRKPIPFNDNTVEIDKEADKLETFDLVCSDLKAGQKLTIIEVETPLGDYMFTNNGKPVTFTSQNKDFVGKSILIQKKDQHNNVIAADTFRFIKPSAELPLDLSSSKFDILTDFLKSVQPFSDPCTSCDFGDRIVYDFSTNSKPKYYIHSPLFVTKKPVVGRTFSFQVININPFRDSVVISNETTDYNTDIPPLFDKSFFNIPGIQAVNNSLLTDVYVLGKQLETIKQDLMQLAECATICDKVKAVRTATESYFAKSPYNYDGKQSLVLYLAQSLGTLSPEDAKKVADILNSYAAFINTKTYFNYNIPQLQNVDEYIFNLSVLPKKGAVSNTIVDHQPIAVPLVGGFKADASTGLFITKLTDYRYAFKDSLVGADSVKKLIRQDNGKWDFGVSALMHFYPRISTWFNVSASIGAGLSIGPNPSVRYLAGGSLLFGRNARLALTFGTAMGFVNRLSEGYETPGYIFSSNKNDITKKVFKAKNFWSLTFNIPIFKSKVDIAKDKADSATDDASGDSAKGDSSKGKTKEEGSAKKK